MLRRNVLIFHAGALGDFVLAWPLALGLGRALAQSRITFITHHQKGQLAETALRLESADIESGWHALHADAASTLTGRPASLLGGAVAIYTFLSPTPAWLANASRLSGDAKIVPLQTRPPAGYPGHASDWMLEQLADHPVERTATQQMLRSIAERGLGGGAARPASSPAATDVLIHPGSGSVQKCWPAECFLQLAQRLRGAGRSVRFVIGEVERERWDSKQRANFSHIAELRQPASPLDLLAEIQSARLVIANDSGPGHLAGIVGVPTLSLFGPASNPAQWKPLGPHVEAISSNSWEGLGVDAVMERADGRLGLA